MPHLNDTTTTNRLTNGTAPKPQPPAVAGKPGMVLQCPCCGDGGEISVDILFPADFYCAACKKSFRSDRVMFYLNDLWSRIDNWLNVMNWVAAMPAECPVPAEAFEEEAA
jgi:hypothetical protein